MFNSYASTHPLSPWDWAGVVVVVVGEDVSFFYLSIQGLSLSRYTHTLAASSIPFQFFCFCAFPGAFISFLPAACSSSSPPLSVHCCCGNPAVWAREQITYPCMIMHYDHRNIQVKSWSPCAIYQVNADLKLRFRSYKHQNTDISRLIAIECYHQF